MSINNIPLLSALQVGQAENMVEAIEKAPAVQQAVAHEAALSEIKAQQGQVNSSSASAKARRKSVEDKNPDARSAGQFQQQPEARQQHDEQEQESRPYQENPWAGVIVDRKV